MEHNHPPFLFIAQLGLFGGAFRADLGIVQLVQMEGTDGKSHLDPFPQKALLHLSFQQQIEAGACEQQIRHRAGVAEFATPGPTVAGAGLQ